jgi:hypothetical protein
MRYGTGLLCWSFCCCLSSRLAFLHIYLHQTETPALTPSVPFIAFWVSWNRPQDRDIHTVAEAFRKKGPAVRLGHDKIAVNFVEGGIETVHNGEFHKSQWYDYLIDYGLVYPAIPSILLGNTAKYNQNSEHYPFKIIPNGKGRAGKLGT